MEGVRVTELEQHESNLLQSFNFVHGQCNCVANSHFLIDQRKTFVAKEISQADGDVVIDHGNIAFIGSRLLLYSK